MRLLKFVPCARPAALPEDSAPRPRLTAAAAAAAASPLSPTTCAYPEKRRRRPSHGSASTWRPSLVAISEDGIPAAAADAKGASRRGGSRMARAKSAGARVHRTGGDDFRNYGVPPVMPAFAPTAFLF